MAYWLKAIGHAKGPLPEAWLDDERWHTRLSRTGFPRRPRIVPGDRLVLYASVWKRVFGIAEVTGEVRPSGHERWPFEVPMEALLVVPHLENAPPIESMGSCRARCPSSRTSRSPRASTTWRPRRSVPSAADQARRNGAAKRRQPRGKRRRAECAP